MTKHYCDRCGIDTTKNVAKITIDYDLEILRIILCEKCRKEVIKMIEKNEAPK